jgi:type II secretory pathway component GspD/PulD (secretin)
MMLKIVVAAAALAVAPALASAQGSVPGATSPTQVASIKPQYLPPAELAQILGVVGEGARGAIEWRAGGVTHSVEVRRNDAANLIMLAGPAEDVAAVEAMVRAADVPPRQIMVEAKIVEVDRDRLKDLGIDWSTISTRADVQQERLKRVSERSSTSSSGAFDVRDETTDDALRILGGASLNQSLKLLEESGAATFRNAPRILTLNNRRATILDGQRVTYITRYSSYTNLFETDTLDAGLTLSVLPSLGESGYLTMDIRAELTSLSREISGSPVKDGQIVENTMIAKDGEMVLLGGFLRTVEEQRRRRFPVLGVVLPFLFSRDVTVRTRRESFVALTPHVVDLAAGVDPRTRGFLQGGGVPER